MVVRILAAAGPAAFVLAVVGSWLLIVAAIAAPLLETQRSSLAPSVYGFLSLFCHQRPSRSWFLLGSNLGLCARTLALYGTVALAGTLVLGHPAARDALARPARRAGLLLILPLVVDGTGQLAGLWASTNASRTITGILAGLGLVRLGLAVARLGAAPAAPGRAAVLLRRSASAALAALLVATGAVPAGSAADGGRVTLKSGTPVFLVFTDSVNSESVTEGQSVPLRVLRDVTAGDTVVIRSGARASARVTGVRKKQGWGTPGALEVYVSDVETVDGQLIPLSARQEAEGENKGSTAAVTGIVLGVLCLPSALWGFAIKGDEGRIPPGAEVKAFTDAEAYIRGR